MRFKKIAVLGLGKVGKLAATLLHEAGFDVTGFDVNVAQKKLPCDVKECDFEDVVGLAKTLEPFEALLSCLPYHLNLNIAKEAHRQGMHYFDLTEDVPTTNAILEMSHTAKGVMAPQCGLAPGFIGIVGADLAKQLDQVRSIKLRVGALPKTRQVIWDTPLIGHQKGL